MAKPKAPSEPSKADKSSANTFPCIANCVSPYQDAKYGKGKRVMNPTKSSAGKGYRCTVCGKDN